MAPTSNSLWDRLRSARLTAGISARELDRLARLAEGHTALLEAGKKNDVETRTVAKLARALGVTLDWLVLGEGDPPADEKILEAVRVAKAALAAETAQAAGAA